MLLLKDLGKNVRKKSMICSNKINPDRFKICRGISLLSAYQIFVFSDSRGSEAARGC